MQCISSIWIDWSTQEQHQEIDRFTRGLIAFRRAHPILSQELFYTDAEIHWFSPQGDLPHWTDPKEKQLGCLIHEDAQHALCLLFNASGDPVNFCYPPYCRRLGGIWPLTPFAKRQKICVLRAKNRFGKIHSCIPWVPDRVSLFWLGDGIVTADGWRDGGCMKHATLVKTVFLDRRDVMGTIGWCLLKQGSG